MTAWRAAIKFAAMSVPSHRPGSRSPFVVGIAGGSGSGKTTLVRRLVDQLGEERVALIEHDSYYCPDPALPFAERQQINYDHPDSLETSLLIEHLAELKAGRGVRIPTYDFARHRRRPEVRAVQPLPVVLVEGILLLCDGRLRALLDLKLFVWAADDVRFIRRLQRDLSERGRTTDSVTRQYLGTVKPMHERYVAPSMQHADLIIRGEGDANPALDVILARLREVG